MPDYLHCRLQLQRRLLKGRESWNQVVLLQIFVGYMLVLLQQYSLNGESLQDVWYIWAEFFILIVVIHSVAHCLPKIDLNFASPISWSNRTLFHFLYMYIYLFFDDAYELWNNENMNNIHTIYISFAVPKSWYIRLSSLKPVGKLQQATY